MSHPLETQGTMYTLDTPAQNCDNYIDNHNDVTCHHLTVLNLTLKMKAETCLPVTSRLSAAHVYITFIHKSFFG